FDAWAAEYCARVAREGGSAEERRARMHAVNPRYSLRNYLAQQVIEAAEAGDFAPLRELHAVLGRPFEAQPGKERYTERPPEWGRHPGITCSSCHSNKTRRNIPPFLVSAVRLTRRRAACPAPSGTHPATGCCR